MNSINNEISELKRMRDELKVRAHLAKADARDLWDRLESKWPDVEAKARELEKQTGKSLDEVKKAAGDLLKEIKDGYLRFKSDSAVTSP